LRGCLQLPRCYVGTARARTAAAHGPGVWRVELASLRRWCRWPGTRCAGDWREPPSDVCGSPQRRCARRARPGQTADRDSCRQWSETTRSLSTEASLLKSHAILSSGAVCAAATSALRKRRSRHASDALNALHLHVLHCISILTCGCCLVRASCVCVTGVLSCVACLTVLVGFSLLVCGLATVCWERV